MRNGLRHSSPNHHHHTHQRPDDDYRSCPHDGWKVAGGRGNSSVIPGIQLAVPASEHAVSHPSLARTEIGRPRMSRLCFMRFICEVQTMLDENLTFWRICGHQLFHRFRVVARRHVQRPCSRRRHRQTDCRSTHLHLCQHGRFVRTLKPMRKAVTNRLLSLALHEHQNLPETNYVKQSIKLDEAAEDSTVTVPDIRLKRGGWISGRVERPAELVSNVFAYLTRIKFEIQGSLPTNSVIDDVFAAKKARFILIRCRPAPTH